MVVFRVAAGVRSHFVARLIEWGLTINLAGFATILLSPPSTFDTARTYDTMRAIGTENEWGVVLLAIAAVRLIALVLNGTFRCFARYSPLARSVCAGLSACVWAVLFLSFLKANPAATGWFNWMTWMWVDAILAVHIARPAGTAWTHGDGPA